MPDFLADYYQKVVSSIGNNHTDNHDLQRFGPESPGSLASVLKRKASSSLSRKGLIGRGETGFAIGMATQLVDGHIEGLKWLYNNLADSESRQTLVDVLAYRALGERKVKLHTNNPTHWENLRKTESLASGSEIIDTGFMGFNLRQIDLGEAGYPIKMFGNPSGIVANLIEEQYRCVTTSGNIECEEGDHVIDAGGCWGDTALYFAHKSGSNGKVSSFEFLPENLQIFEKNLALNPELSDRIQIIRNPVWSHSDEVVSIDANGPATQVSVSPNNENQNVIKCKTVAIDDLVKDGTIQRIDFIKMDIEGAELNALKGTSQSIIQFKPRMAITVYHSLNDFWEIPMLIDRLKLGYEFYLRHFTIHSEETVLFARPT